MNSNVVSRPCSKNKFNSMEQQLEKETEKSNPMMIPGAIILAGVLIAGAVIYSNSGGLNLKPSPKGNFVATGENSGSEVSATGDITDDDPFLGKPDAPVTMVEFSDFQCPFCRQMWRNTLPQIKEKYLLTGKARLVYRDFPLSIHPAAQVSAEAAECADDQGKFWEMHDKIFEEQDKLGVGTIQYGESELKRWAAEIGLSRTQFNNCLDTHKYKDEVEKDFNDGARLGVTGTPATFINGRLISGAVPFAQFEQAIEAELKKAGK